MKRTPLEVYKAFRISMLDGTDAWMDLIAEKVVLVGPLARIEGKGGFIEVNKPFFSSIQESIIEQLLETENFVLTRIVTKVAMPSGKIISLEVSEWYEIKDNLIQSLRVYFDTDEFRKELVV